MNRLKVSSLAMTLMMLTGCAGAIDKTLSPPSDTQWVNVEIKNPSPYTKPFPLEVVYLSDVCKKRYISGFDGKRVEEVSYNPINIPLQQQGNSDIYHARIAMTGGGSCQWKLSEFNLGIEYIDAKHLGPDLVPGTAVGATIAFDNVASRNGQFEDVSGDLNLTPKYYPFIKRYSRIKNSTKADALTLFSDENSFASYRVYPEARKDYFLKYYPVIDEAKFAELIFPYEKGKGVRTKIVYPDGSFTSDGTIYPNSKKYKEMEGMKQSSKP